MNEPGLWVMLAVPIVMAMCQGLRRGQRLIGWITACSALPALLLMLFGGTGSIEVPWLLFGSRLGIDAVGRVFLGATAALWLAAGLYARSYLAHDEHRGRFHVFFLLTMTGNLGIAVAQDAASFLAFFTLMSVAAYGLIVHDRRASSLRAGRVYMVMTISGEMLLFAGLVLLAFETRSLAFEGLSAGLAETPRRDLIIGLLLAGFGIKLGVMPLHGWLPMAHPAAPTPASAMLSGAMIKTGLLGLLRTLPLGVVALPGWANVCLVAGIATSLLAALIGTAQRNPKAVLAYSSISQMGLVMVGLGAALAAPAAWPAISSMLLLWVVHHATAKAALFLGVGVADARFPSRWSRHLVQAGLLVAALSLAGLPLTMGFAAKSALKYSTAAVEPWTAGLVWLLPLTSVATTLLVSRFLWLVWPARRNGHGDLRAGMAIPWVVLTAGVVAGFFFARSQGLVNAAWLSLGPLSVWASIWPMLVAGIVVLLVATRPGVASGLARLNIPEGDIVVPVTAVARWFRREWNRIAVVHLPNWFQTVRQAWHDKAVPVILRSLDRLSQSLENDLTAGLLVAALVIILFAVSVGI
jgi:formate hydrogenlyase subunit 3/multisubunit Na+/H+ antiporter MnhD subunit